MYYVLCVVAGLVGGWFLKGWWGTPTQKAELQSAESAVKSAAQSEIKKL